MINVFQQLTDPRLTSTRKVITDLEIALDAAKALLREGVQIHQAMTTRDKPIFHIEPDDNFKALISASCVHIDSRTARNEKAFIEQHVDFRGSHLRWLDVEHKKEVV